MIKKFNAHIRKRKKLKELKENILKCYIRNEILTKSKTASEHAVNE